MQGPSISVIIPAYNEEQYVKESIEINMDILRNSNVDYEIIIVDDGSLDKTASIIKQHFSDLPGVKLLLKDWACAEIRQKG